MREDVVADAAALLSIPDTPGEVTEAGLRDERLGRRPLPRRVAPGRRRRRDRQPDGGRGDRGDLPLAGLAVGSRGPLRRGAVRRGDRPRSRPGTEAKELFSRARARLRAGRVPHAARVHSPGVTLDTTKADDIALVIEEAIVSGELAPGTVLRQEQLSEQFNVSRTPMREALRRLAALGLVSFVPNRGVRVRTISRDELHEAFIVRAELEGLATEVATRRRSRPRSSAELDAVRAAVRDDLAGACAPRAGRRAALDHGRLGAGEPRLPRRHLPRRRPAARRAAREERPADVLGAGRLGARATTRSTGCT